MEGLNYYVNLTQILRNNHKIQLEIILQIYLLDWFISWRAYYYNILKY